MAETILIVDDNLEDRYIFRAILNKINSSCTLHEVHNGLEALARLRTEELFPDIIFLDLNMTLMSGMVFLTKLKEDEKLKNIPVIIYTGSNFETDVTATRELGAVHYITKMSNIHELEGEIKKGIQLAGKMQAS